MILDSLFAMVCSGISTETLGGGKMPCSQIINQASDQSKITQTMNELQSYAENFAYKNINGQLIKITVATGFLINAASQKSLMLQIPLKPFEFYANINQTSQMEGIKFKYEF